MSDKKGTILLIEDNESIRKVYSDILSYGGYGVLTAGDGELGWELAKAKKPDFILLDLEMPKMDGFEVLQRIRGDATTKTIPVIVFSAMHMQEDIRKALNLGATGYMTKGVHTPRYVLGTIRSLLPEIAFDPPPKAGSPNAQIKEYQQDVDGSWKEVISARGYRCPRCDDEMIQEMFPGPEQDGSHWFYSRFVCPKCSVFF